MPSGLGLLAIADTCSSVAGRLEALRAIETRLGESALQRGLRACSLLGPGPRLPRRCDLIKKSAGVRGISRRFWASRPGGQPALKERNGFRDCPVQPLRHPSGALQSQILSTPNLEGTPEGTKPDLKSRIAPHTDRLNRHARPAESADGPSKEALSSSLDSSAVGHRGV
jgi:hypothetical protein